MRNKRREKRLQEMGVSEDERVARGKLLGEQDATDFENIYVSFPPPIVQGTQPASNVF